MPSRQFHLARAKYNKVVSDFLLEQHPDWALVTLFYSAMHYVHSSLADEPNTPKDERHPRAHTSSQPGARGTNQMLLERFPSVAQAYLSLFELSHRTRYDVLQLGPMTIPGAKLQWQSVKTFCEGLNATRDPIPTQQP
jgi:hypothetical protein